MKKTEQYNLNQWEASDRIRMEDFNVDNAKLETALAGKTGRLEYIGSFSDGEGKSNAGLITGVRDWNQWDQVILFADLRGTTFSEKDILILTMAFSDYSYTDSLRISAGSFAVVFFPRHDASNNVHIMVVGKNGGLLFAEAPYSRMHGVGLAVLDPTFASSTKFSNLVTTIYGIR